jgi:hypothetical protein
MCGRLYSLVKSLTAQLREILSDPKVDPKGIKYYNIFGNLIKLGLLEAITPCFIIIFYTILF